jgi:hypothetical protein
LAIENIAPKASTPPKARLRLQERAILPAYPTRLKNDSLFLNVMLFLVVLLISKKFINPIALYILG